IPMFVLLPAAGTDCEEQFTCLTMRSESARFSMDCQPRTQAQELLGKKLTLGRLTIDRFSFSGNLKGCQLHCWHNTLCFRRGKCMKLETLAIHAAAEADPATGSVAPPIHLSTNFVHGPAGEETFGYMYIRDKNPTQDRLEAALAALEGGEDALVF